MELKLAESEVLGFLDELTLLTKKYGIVLRSGFCGISLVRTTDIFEDNCYGIFEYETGEYDSLTYDSRREHRRTHNIF